MCGILFILRLLKDTIGSTAGLDAAARQLSPSFLVLETKSLLIQAAGGNFTDFFPPLCSFG
jgi:hypothetical protein